MKTIELFCGAGLLGQGFSQAGFKTLFAADLDREAIASYNKNLKHKVAELWDVSSIKPDLKCDVIIAGPPCQGFSTLGKRDKSDARNKLSLVLLKWAVSTEAKVVVIENVPQFLKSTYFKILSKKFGEMGYISTAWVLNASDYGVAQNRKRSFTIFSKVGLPEIPVQSKNKLTVRDAFKGLKKPAKEDVEHLHYNLKLSEDALERVKLIPKNGSKFDLMKNAPHLCPDSWFAMGRQAVDVWGRMHYNAPSNTIRCCFWNPSKGRYLHPIENRVITLREAARLQGIPDSWRFSGTKSAIARQIGNGVPVPLAHAIAKSVRRLF